jgi:chromosome segregation ATPase
MEESEKQARLEILNARLKWLEERAKAAAVIIAQTEEQLIEIREKRNMKKEKIHAQDRGPKRDEKIAGLRDKTAKKEEKLKHRLGRAKSVFARAQAKINNLRHRVYSYDVHGFKMHEDVRREHSFPVKKKNRNKKLKWAFRPKKLARKPKKSIYGEAE